jgi:drug/metabolite transporter (DMT)-like permease
VNQKTKGAGSLLAGAFVVSTFGIWARFIAPMFSAAAQTATRCLLAAAFMGVLVLLKRGKYKLRGYTRREYVYIALLGFLTVALSLLFIASVTATKVGNTSSLIYAGSIVTSFIVGTFFLGEKTSVLRVTAIVVALAGLTMYAPDLLSLKIGILTGFGAGICDGLSNVARKQLRNVDNNAAVLYQYVAAGFFAIPFVLLPGNQPVQTVHASSIAAMLAYAVAALVFAKLLLHGFSRFDVNVGGVILAMQIFFGMLLGFLVFHEVPSANELAGSVMIFMAVLLAVSSSKKASVPAKLEDPTTG